MKSGLVENTYSILRQVLGEAKSPIGLHEPTLGDLEKEFVLKAIDSGYVSSVGQYVGEFEQTLSKYTGSPYAIAVVNGTAALHVCYLLAGVGQGDEVLVPSLTFVATVNAISYCGAVPHFIDVETKTLGVDVSRVRSYLQEIGVREGRSFKNRKTGRPIKAIVGMHTFGYACDVEGLKQIADEFGLAFIEDAAEALGTKIGARAAGTFGDLAALSFNGNKLVTTGGGGAILTGDAELARKAKHLTTTGKRPHAFEFYHDTVAYNYRLPNINAALGMAQMARLDKALEMKRKLWQAYSAAAADLDGVEIFGGAPADQPNHWLICLLLPKATDRKTRDQVIHACQEKGYLVRPAWQLMHTLPMYQDCPQMNLDQSIELENRIISLPSTPSLGAGLV